MNRRFLRSWLLLLLPLSLMAAPRSPPSPRSVSATNGVVSVECTLIGSKLSSITVPRTNNRNRLEKAAMHYLPGERHLQKHRTEREIVSAEFADAAWDHLRKTAKNLDTDSSHDFLSEVRSYFGTGTQLQELYITPYLLSARDLDTLAAAARWAAANADTLKDTHWIGGDPAVGAVYGWAAWSSKKGIVTLRNPGGTTQTVSIDPPSAFELPEGAAKQYELVSPYPDQPVGKVQELKAGEAAEFELKPYEVLVLGAIPKL
jgi:hypothetical protein